MVALGIVGIVLAVILGVVAVGIIIGGLWFIASFAEVILCVVFIVLAIKILFKKVKKK